MNHRPYNSIPQIPYTEQLKNYEKSCEWFEIKEVFSVKKLPEILDVFFTLVYNKRDMCGCHEGN